MRTRVHVRTEKSQHKIQVQLARFSPGTNRDVGPVPPGVIPGYNRINRLRQVGVEFTIQRNMKLKRTETTENTIIDYDLLINYPASDLMILDFYELYPLRQVLAEAAWVLLQTGRVEASGDYLNLGQRLISPIFVKGEENRLA
ncbi:hypothetical protein llap_7190 [Limosa lapponica baueri]|uniref:Uncharacterized protein n=1 Tax=Limosa lapponica baueri TaxID=1758121 RepID=A0A2I0U903_LIMLA|nr:hypothetical protein llap_7190 [Limosa lapponica baueri]